MDRNYNLPLLLFHFSLVPTSFLLIGNTVFCLFFGSVSGFVLATNLLGMSLLFSVVRTLVFSTEEHLLQKSLRDVVFQ
jgi:hypothetical protein